MDSLVKRNPIKRLNIDTDVYMQTIVLRKIAAENTLLLWTGCDPPPSSQLCADIQVLLKMSKAGASLLKAMS